MNKINIGGVEFQTEYQCLVVETSDKSKVFVGLDYHDIPRLRNVELPADLAVENFDSVKPELVIRSTEGKYSVLVGIGGVQVLAMFGMAIILPNLEDNEHSVRQCLEELLEKTKPVKKRK